ncbi:MAG: bifunctional glutamate N-acetyltransferase/amino-acid acetyltransferase ArgJ [Methylacidiphilales bacterium]|nr:bifunctional glutamate N-acetyltransferase/amino-acid acetyltransferase ArgJ [Candidatus Methylacidiphilales bacterium]
MPRQSIDTLLFATEYANIKIANLTKDDLLLVQIPKGSTVCQVLTTNALKAAPVLVAKQHLSKNKHPAYLLFNSGNANAATGKRGIEDCFTICAEVATLLGIHPHLILPYSTGVIGESMPLERILPKLPSLVSKLGKASIEQAATAIMTTDTYPKHLSVHETVDRHPTLIQAFAKGAGMIHPNMATLLGCISVQANCSLPILKKIFKNAIKNTFNRITIDGDTSTNDSFVCVAIPHPTLTISTKKQQVELESILTTHLNTLAMDIVRDGEGATLIITIKIHKAKNYRQAELVAQSIALSPLVKTAMHARDPNWGRIAAAIGKADQSIKMDKVSIAVNSIICFSRGERDTKYQEHILKEKIAQGDICIDVYLNQGNASFSYQTCDLSAEYVRINADYRT